VARDLVERGYLALEAIGDRKWEQGWVLPERFLSGCGFRVLRDDPRFPLMRLDLLAREPVKVVEERATLPLPAFDTV
jgi:hypothetical protein